VAESLIHAKEQQLKKVQDGAIEAASVNYGIQYDAADILEAKLGDAKKNTAAATRDYDNANGSSNIEKARSKLFQVQQAEEVAENAAAAARRNCANATSLWEQAGGTARGDLDAAHDNLTRARDHYVAAEMKLNAASDKTITSAARKEFDRAARQLEAAEHETKLAEDAMTYSNSQPLRRPDRVVNIQNR
jgi:hypothetical protein